MTALSLALVVGAILAARPAGARAVVARQPDALADAATTALAALNQRAAVRQLVPASRLVNDDPTVQAAEQAYAAARGAVAALAAPRAGVDGPGLDAVWAATTDQRMVAVLAALSQVGVPYRGFKAIPGYGFDCSGLTSYAWSVAGVALAHNSSAQIRAATPRPLDAAQPGDLVQYPGHVMLALGYGHAIVHAPHTGQVVEVRPWTRASRAGSPA
jgi:cell wall-associated NlpC family hydrolase